MTNLKDQLIRLGSTDPELRRDLRPILDHLTMPYKRSSMRKNSKFEWTVENVKREWPGWEVTEEEEKYIGWNRQLIKDLYQELGQPNEVDDTIYLWQDEFYQRVDIYEPTIISWKFAWRGDFDRGGSSDGYLYHENYPNYRSFKEALFNEINV